MSLEAQEFERLDLARGLNARATSDDARVFSVAELKRVGTATTLLVITGTIVIVGMTIALGHYNSLAHAFPKAALDGAVIALLLGQRQRWRLLSLMGAVYGLVLLLQVGVFYLLPVTIVAAVVAAVAGWAIGAVHRGLALLVAAVLYELLAGCGAPIKIYFSTDGRSEPFIWGLWLAELPLRAVGAAIGVWLACRFCATSSTRCAFEVHPSADDCMPLSRPARTARARRARGMTPTALRIVACAVACVLPMGIADPYALAGIAAVYLIYALSAGARWKILHAMLGLVWGWVVLGALSFAWNQDWPRVLDLGRTLVLRFMPITLASIVLVTTIRPVDVVRLLRKLRLGGWIILPLSMVLRSIPHSRRLIQSSMHSLRASGQWTGPASLFRRPVTVIRALLAPQIRHLADQLAEEPTSESSRT